MIETENTNASAVPQSDASGPPADAMKKSSAPELPEGEMSFAEMFELAEKQAKEREKVQKAERAKAKAIERDLYPGLTIDARVVGFSHDSVFMDVGGKAEGVVAKVELQEEDGSLPVKEGDTVEVRVISTSGGTVKLGKVLPHMSTRNREAVRQAYEAGLPVEVKVSAKNSGGLEVSLSGLRAFLPTSQIDLRPVANPESLIGTKIAVKITEYKEGGRNLVVSRRAVLLEEQKKKVAEAIDKIQVGAELDGKVTSVKDYGAFIDLGGVEGLVHLSEISHAHVAKATDVLSVGQTVRVKVKKIEDKKEKEPKEGEKQKRPRDSFDGGKKISLSMKDLEGDPWARARSTFSEGARITGKVARIQPFGAFVELAPGIDGLIHVSKMGPERIKDPSEVLKVGDEVSVRVDKVEWDKKRISLSLGKSQDELASEIERGAVHDGFVEEVVEGKGIRVKLPSGARGFVPSHETGTARGTDLKKEFQKGQKVKVTVLDSEKRSGKTSVRLSIKQVAEAEERAEYTNYVKGTSGSGFGTFGDLFRNIKRS